MKDANRGMGWAAWAAGRFFPKQNANWSSTTMEEKSRHEIIMRAKISYAEQKTNMNMRAWIDRELREIGMNKMTDEECDSYALAAMPRIF